MSIAIGNQIIQTGRTRLGSIPIEQTNLGSTTIYSNYVSPIPGGALIYTDPNSATSYPNGTGSIVYDLSGNGNNAIITGSMQYTGSTAGVTANWRGGGGVINYGDVGDTYNQITVIQWAKTYTLDRGGVIGKWNTNAQSNACFRIDITPQTNPFNPNLMRYNTYVSNNGSGFIAVEINNAITGSKWYCMALTYDGQTMISYLNGVGVGSSAFGSPTALFNSNQGLYVGLEDQGGAFYLNGDIGATFVYKRALSSTQMLNIFDATKTIYGY